MRLEMLSRVVDFVIWQKVDILFQIGKDFRVKTALQMFNIIKYLS